MSDRCLGSPSFAARKPYLSMSLVVLNYKMKEDEEASNFKLTTDSGFHHRGSVLGSVSKFSGSSFFSTGMVTWEHPWGNKTYSVEVKARVKRSKNMQNTKKTISKRDTGI